MKLTKCILSGFGVFSTLPDTDQVINFNEHLNCIRKDNGKGKTTLTKFIKYFLFNHENTKKNSDNMKDIECYQPDNGAFEGKAYFKKDNSLDEYAISIQNIDKLGKKTIENDIVLYKNDAEYNDIDSMKLGQEILNISADVYNNLLTVDRDDLKQNKLNIISNSINDKITGVSGSQSDLEYDMFKVRDKVMGKESHDKSLSSNFYKTVEVDIIEEKKDQIELISDDINDLEERNAELELNYKEASEKQHELVESIKANQALLGKTTSSEKVKRYKELDSELKITDDRLHEIRNNFNEEPSVELVEELKKLYDSINENSDSNIEEKKKGNNVSLIICLILAILSLVASVVTYVINLDLKITIICAGVALVFFIICLFIKIFTAKAEKEKKLKAKHNFNKRIKEICTFTTDIFELIEVINIYKNLSENHNSILNKINNLGITKSDIENFIDEDLDSNKLNNDIAKAQKELKDIQNYMKDLEDEKEQIREKLDIIANNEKLNREIDILEQEKNIRIKTWYYLYTASTNLKTKNRATMTTNFNKYFKLFDDKDVSIDASTIKANNINEKRLSMAQNIILNLCLHLACINCMFDNAVEKPFVVFDDPFVDLDENNFNIVKDIIRKFSETYQVLYFTCHSSRLID